MLEKILQNYFKSLDLHIIYDGGTEFLKNDIIKLVISFLQKINIKFKVLSRIEINNLIRKSYYKFKKINIKNFLSILKKYASMLNCHNLKTKRPYKSNIINYSTIKLNEEHRIYIELDTGGCKSVISYSSN